MSLAERPNRITAFDAEPFDVDPYLLERQFIMRVRQRVEEAEATERKIAEATRYNPFAHYEGDYLAFAQTELGEHYTEDQVRLFKAIIEYPVVLARTGNSVGKSRVAAGLGISYFFCHLDAQVFTFMAPPEDNLRMILWAEIGGFVERHPRLFENLYKVSLPGMEIKRSEGSFITGITIPVSADPAKMKARFSGKHSPHQLFIGDEIDAVPKPIFEAIETCASGEDAKQFYSFNPRAQSGPAYQMEAGEEAVVVEISEFTHPNVITGENLIPGAISRERVVWRINKWSRPVVPGERIDRKCYEVPEFLVGVVGHDRDKARTPFPPLPPGYRVITNPAFSYVVLGDYPSEAEYQLISLADVEAAMERWQSYVKLYGEKPPVDRPNAGLDVGDQGPDDSVLTLKFGSWVARQLEEKLPDPVLVGEWARDILVKNVAKDCKVDGTGVGAGSVRPIARKGITVYKVMVQSKEGLEEVFNEDLGLFYSVRDAMLFGLREWLRLDPAAMLPPSQRLKEELITPTYEKRKGEIKVMDSDTMRELLGRSPDRLMSLGLIFAPAVNSIKEGFAQANYLTGEHRVLVKPQLNGYGSEGFRQVGGRK